MLLHPADSYLPLSRNIYTHVQHITSVTSSQTINRYNRQHKVVATSLPVEPLNSEVIHLVFPMKIKLVIGDFFSNQSVCVVLKLFRNRYKVLIFNSRRTCFTLER